MFISLLLVVFRGRGIFSFSVVELGRGVIGFKRKGVGRDWFIFFFFFNI